MTTSFKCACIGVLVAGAVVLLYSNGTFSRAKPYVHTAAVSVSNATASSESLAAHRKPGQPGDGDRDEMPDHLDIALLRSSGDSYRPRGDVAPEASKFFG